MKDHLNNFPHIFVNKICRIYSNCIGNTFESIFLGRVYFWFHHICAGWRKVCFKVSRATFYFQDSTFDLVSCPILCGVCNFTPSLTATIVSPREVLRVPYLQLLKKYLRKTLVFLWNTAIQKKLNFYLFSSFWLLMKKFLFWH